MLSIVTNRLLLKFPFVDPNNVDNEILNIIQCNLDFSTIPVSDSLRDLLKHMLDCNQETRYTADDVINHPWMQGNREEMTFNWDHCSKSDSYLESDPSSTSEKILNRMTTRLLFSIDCLL